MKTLNNEETRLVENALGNSVVVHSAAIVRVYLAVEGKWEKQTMGAAAIITDRNVNSHFLKVVELGSRKVCFTQELYNNFEYICPKNFFHTFETDESVAGFSFADESEANEFYTKVTECRSTPPQRMINQALAPPISSRPISPPPPSSPPSSSYRHTTSFESSPNSSSPSSLTASYSGKSGSSKKKKGGFLSGIFGKEEEEELVVSEPSNFRHVSSIGWNPSEASFEIRNIPPEWKKLFQAAGIKKSELKNKDTAAFVMNIIEQNTGADLRTPGATKVPPPPPGGPRAPPPPPGGPRGGAPPPPPPGGPRGGAPPPPPPGGPRGGAPPPPPPPGSRPPPTQSYEEPSSSSAPPPPPPPPGNSSGGGEAPRNALLDQIRSGKTLRRVDDEAKDNGNSNSNGGSATGGGLAETLARAMAERRAHIREDVKQEDEWSDGEWSDNE